MTKHLIDQITDLLKQANALAETLDNFELSTAEVRVSCTDGTCLVIGDILQNYSDGTTGESSLSQLTTAAAHAADQLGTIKKNIWF
ncbi:hypothetical protein [uncultured Marinobacter sp.]|uniref:hypothetical protein n=1 Tax=uncultured Marinobacter sp. TaxID=187379 RepID=UPI0026345F81|nr:hypothetical protein [uncultured Marinobacter sp.]